VTNGLGGGCSCLTWQNAHQTSETCLTPDANLLIIGNSPVNGEPHLSIYLSLRPWMCPLEERKDWNNAGWAGYP
jgi:hypothetical protein